MKYLDLNDVDLNKKYNLKTRGVLRGTPTYEIRVGGRNVARLYAYLIESRCSRDEDFDNWYGDYILETSSTKAIQFYYNWLTSNGFTEEEAKKFECKITALHGVLSSDIVKQILKRQSLLYGGNNT